MQEVASLPSEIVDFIEECKKDERPESQLIAVLHKVQMHYGYLPRPILDDVAQRLQVPTAVVSGVSSFYHFFRLTPKGKYTISVCMGTACFVKGADKILEAIQSQLGIEIGETTGDGFFTLEQSRCLGVCALAPVMTINDKVYSRVTPTKIPEILNQLRNENDTEQK
ncbi:MAG: NADH-quinone oxidoreductase subunit NuoE [Clostridiales bacterium]|nr:NADH-quinone oxidoreductase subunit NuoE [Clostridiales bacterium]